VSGNAAGSHFHMAVNNIGEDIYEVKKSLYKKAIKTNYAFYCF